MSDKPDPLHLGGGPTSPIWLQQSAKAWGGFCPGSPACSCPSPACSAFIFPLKEGAPGFSQLQDSPFFIALAFSPAIPFAPLSSTDVLSRRPLGTALFIHCLPTPPRSCPHWGTDPPIVSSCPVSHLLESRGTRQPLPPPSLSATSRVRPLPSALAFKLNILIFSGGSSLHRWGMGGVPESRGWLGDACKH